MPKGAKRGREEAEDYDSDGGFVANDDDDGQDVAPKKKSKKAPTSAKGKDVADEKFWEVRYTSSAKVQSLSFGFMLHMLGGGTNEGLI